MNEINEVEIEEKNMKKLNNILEKKEIYKKRLYLDTPFPRDRNLSNNSRKSDSSPAM